MAFCSNQKKGTKKEAVLLENHPHIYREREPSLYTQMTADGGGGSSAAPAFLRGNKIR